MTRIGELVSALCPTGVPYKAIGDLGELIRGNGMPKSDFMESGIGCIHYGQIYTWYDTWTVSTISFVSKKTAERLARVNPGDLVITNTSENLEDVCKAVAWLGQDQIVTGGHATVLRHNEDPKWLAYYFQSPHFFAEKKKHATGTKVIDVSAKSLSKIRIPVPPLEVQREIVRVLDSFRGLKAELEAELEAEVGARQRQYRYYRDTLLTFADDVRASEASASKQASSVRWVTLNEVATFKYGFTAKAKEFGAYRFIRITDITNGGKLMAANAKYVDSTSDATDYLVQAGDLLVARTGATFGKTVLIGSAAPAVFASFLIKISVNKEMLLPGFYWHFAQSGAYWRQTENLVSRGGQPQFNANVLRTIKLPIPPVEEQQRIVTILDRFDVLVNDLDIDLSRELKARRQQYEYYRDRLLTFREAA